MNRQEMRKLQRETDPMAIGKKVLEKALQTMYDVMRDNRIGDDRAEKILKEVVDRMGE